MTPRYLETYSSGQLARIAQQATAMLESCRLCPRGCKINRLKGQKSFCKTADKAAVYSYLCHEGEEPPVSGSRGSGTIFFSHCTMACHYCQNFEFSQKGGGSKELTPAELADIMLELQGRGCHNLNFVTPTHVLPQILNALLLAIPGGLNIPLVYNTSGYELAERIRMLDGIIDIYLPDMRYGDSAMSRKYSLAPDYPAYNQAAVKEMFRQVGTAVFDLNGIIERGLIIRHLVLPGGASGTETIMRFIAQELSTETYISLMSQYTPYYKAAEYPEINRRISQQEYKQAQQIMEEYGLGNGWVQEAGGLESLAGVHIKPVFKKESEGT